VFSTLSLGAEFHAHACRSRQPVNCNSGTPLFLALMAEVKPRIVRHGVIRQEQHPERAFESAPAVNHHIILSSKRRSQLLRVSNYTGNPVRAPMLNGEELMATFMNGRSVDDNVIRPLRKLPHEFTYASLPVVECA
jgi:hypothetical protein